MAHTSAPASSLTVSERRWLGQSTALVLFATVLPHIVCAFSAGPDWAFSGVLVNPSDSFSYLAKLRMGWEGKWVFHLPYTVAQGPGGLLFLFYIGLGHVAYWLSLPLPFVFHVARLISGAAMLWMVYRLAARVSDSIALRRQMWWLVAVSSGLGLLAEKLPLGYSYYESQMILYNSTFYCLIANAHFPAALALTLAMMILALDTRAFSWAGTAGFCLCSWALALILPFSSLVVYFVLAGTLAAIWLRDRAFPFAQSLTAAIGGASSLPLLLYMRHVTEADPTLQGWASQNTTPSLPSSALLLAYGLLILFLIPGAKAAWRRKSDWDVLLLSWVALALAMMHVPYSLQARFSLGLHIPVAILAAQGLADTLKADWQRKLATLAMAATSTYIVVSLLGRSPVSVALEHYKLMYVSKHELAAYDWLRQHVPVDKIVLCAPESGLMVPAYSGHKVVYGHLVETIDAANKAKLVKGFFQGGVDQAAVLREQAIDYVLVGKREMALGKIDAEKLKLDKVFGSGDVSVYKVM